MIAQIRSSASGDSEMTVCRQHVLSVHEFPKWEWDRNKSLAGLHFVGSRGGAIDRHVGRGRHVAGVDRVELLDVANDAAQLRGKSVDFGIREREARELRHVKHEGAIDVGARHVGHASMHG